MIILIKNVPREAEGLLRKEIRRLLEDYQNTSDLFITYLGDAGLRVELKPTVNILSRDNRGRFETSGSFLLSAALKTLQRYYPDAEVEK